MIIFKTKRKTFCINTEISALLSMVNIYFTATVGGLNSQWYRDLDR